MSSFMSKSIDIFEILAFFIFSSSNDCFRSLFKVETDSYTSSRDVASSTFSGSGLEMALWISLDFISLEVSFCCINFTGDIGAGIILLSTFFAWLNVDVFNLYLASLGTTLTVFGLAAFTKKSSGFSFNPIGSWGAFGLITSSWTSTSSWIIFSAVIGFASFFPTGVKGSSFVSISLSGLDGVETSGIFWIGGNVGGIGEVFKLKGREFYKAKIGTKR